MTDQTKPYYDPNYKRRRAAAQQAKEQAAADAKRAKQATLPRAVVVPVEEWTIAKVCFWLLDKVTK